MTVSATTVSQYYTAIFRTAPTAAVSTAYQAMANDTTALNSMLSAANTMVDPVIRLYQTAFNRLPDTNGMTSWVVAYDTGAITLQQIANGFTTSTEFLTKYPASMSNAQYVGALYWNILQRQGEDAGISGWVKALDSGALTRAQVLLGFSESAEFKANVEPAIDHFLTNIAYTPVADQGAAVLYTGSLFDVSIPGKSYLLTNNIDTIDITTPNTADVVKGIYVSDATKNTFSIGDEIKGNTFTKVQVVVENAGTPLLPFVTMSKVDKFDVLMGVTGSITANASSYGTDISSITLAGLDSSTLNVTNLAVTGALKLAVDGSTDGTINSSGKMDGNSFTANLYNDDISTAAAVSFGVAGTTVVLGENDTFYGDYTQKSVKSGDATVGDLNVGNQSIVVGKNGAATVSYTNYASVSKTGTATAGNMKIGTITIDAAVSAEAYVYGYNYAESAKGAANAGSMTIGNIDIKGATSVDSVSMYFSNYAISHKGNATVGNLTFGNINAVMANSSASVTVSGFNYARANTSGDATVGNLTVGNINYVAGKVFDSPDFSFTQNAFATKGNATVGNITFGDVSFVGGKQGGEITWTAENHAQVSTTGNAVAGSITVGNINLNVGYDSSGNLSLTNYAEVDVKGNATVGNITVGNVTLNAGTSGTASLSISNHAYSAKGAATAGNITIGNVTGTALVEGSLELYVYNYADGTVGDKAGNITIGNVSLYAQQSGDLYYSVELTSDTGSVGSLQLGNIDMKVDDFAYMSLSIDITAQTDVGSVSIGNITNTLGQSAELGYQYIDISSSKGSVSSFKVGDVTVVGAKGSYDSDRQWYVDAGQNIGSVTIGNVVLTGGENANFDSGTKDFTADKGNIGSIVMGSTTITGGINANVYDYATFDAGGSIGNVSVGNVTLSAAKSGSAWFSHSYQADNNIGNVAYGNISMTANGKDSDAGGSFWMTASGSDVGTITVGNVTLVSTGQNADSYFGVYAYNNVDVAGLMKVGNVSYTGTNTKTATDSATGYVQFHSSNSVVVGDVSLTAAAATKSYVNSATVNFDLSVTADSGSVTVGNITVVGGSKNASQVMDQFGDLANWLHLNASSKTIGNVDYSGYVTAATIDVSGFGGAAVIKAAQKDTAITDNKYKNEIYLGAGNDTVDMNAVTSLTNKSDANAIDVIYNFASTKDSITIVTSTGNNDFVFVTANAGTYANFLTAAGTNMTNFGTDLYVGKVGSDLYAAVDDNGNGTVDFVIKLAGISTVLSTDFTITT